MKRNSVQNAYRNIRPDEEARSRMLNNILLSSEIPPAGKDDTMNRRKMKPILIAATIVLSVLLMGSAILPTIAESWLFDFPLIESSEIAPEDVHLTVSDITPTSMHISCVIDGVVPNEMAIYILTCGSFTLEKQTESGWQKLPVMVEDPEWDPDEVLTDGSTDWIVDWTSLYGVLETGTYRYTAQVLEGNVPTSVEFVVTQMNNDLSDVLNDILESEYYHIRYTTRNEFGSFENLSSDEKMLIESEYANIVWVEEHWKLGEDMLYTSARNGHPWTGMLYKDGMKYQLDHEGNDRTNPIIGWSPWPDGDMFWLTLWANTLYSDTDALEAKYAPDGTLETVTRVIYSEKYQDAYDVEVTTTEVWEFIATDVEEIAVKFAEQDIDAAQVFSWEEDKKNMKALDVEFVNTTAKPVATASEAIERAIAECTVEHDKILVYRDEEAGMWKVEFQIMYGYQGYQYVYLNDEGITKMVSGAGSKVEEWKNLYPDP